MYDEGSIQVNGSGLWVLLAFCATIIFRTGAIVYPAMLDVFFAIIIGGLALALVKLTSYVIREYLMDILIGTSGAAPVVKTRATQTITNEERTVESSGVRTGPQISAEFIQNGFLTVGNKSVRLTEEEQDELLVAIVGARSNPDHRVYFTKTNLENKLTKLGLFDNWHFTPDGAKLFNLHSVKNLV